MTDKADRFRERKARMAASTPALALVPEASENPSKRPQGVDVEFLAQLRRVDEPVSLDVCQAEVDALLKRMSDEDGTRRFDQLLNECKRSVIQSIAGPFGLGQVTARFDVTGGPVDTVHNNRDGVFSTAEAKERFDRRTQYKNNESRKREFHTHENYRGTNAAASGEFKGEGAGVQDAYRDTKMHKLKGDKIHLDHATSASALNDDAGVILAGLDPVELANRSSNLNVTSESINTSKKHKSAGEYAQWLRATSAKRQKDIHELEQIQVPTPKQQNELRKLKELEAVDIGKLEDAHRRSQEDIDGCVNDTYYNSEEFKKAVKDTSFAEAKRMAKQQAIGALLAEFFIGVVDEIQDWHKAGRRELMLAARLKRVGLRVLGRWKHVLTVGFQGALAGFLSNLGTVLINIFVTTEKRLVRMVREGFMSLLRAITTLVFRPTGMTFAQAAHEATKIACAGGIVIGGVVIEELVAHHLNAIGLGFVAGFATAIIVGSITGIVTALAAYGLDKLDLFGVEADARSARIQTLLDKGLEESIAECDSLVLELEALNATELA